MKLAPQLPIIVFLAAAIFAFPSDKARAAEITAIRAVSADVLAAEDAGGRKILLRLDGIWPPEGREAGEKARQALENLASGREIILKDAQGEDRHGRISAQAYLADGGTHLQAAMVEAGFAAASGCLLRDAEEKAVAAKAGLWGEGGLSYLTPNEIAANVAAYDGRMAIVRGEVKSASRIRNRVYLNFGDDWRRDFTVEIAAKNLKFFKNAGTDPLSWGGKVVVARGVAQKRAGISMEISEPCRAWR